MPITLPFNEPFEVIRCTTYCPALAYRPFDTLNSLSFGIRSLDETRRLDQSEAAKVARAYLNYTFTQGLYEPRA